MTQVTKPDSYLLAIDISAARRDNKWRTRIECIELSVDQAAVGKAVEFTPRDGGAVVTRMQSRAKRKFLEVLAAPDEELILPAWITSLEQVETRAQRGDGEYGAAKEIWVVKHLVFGARLVFDGGRVVLPPNGTNAAPPPSPNSPAVGARAR